MDLALGYDIEFVIDRAPARSVVQGEPLSFGRGAFRGTLGYHISGLVFGLGFIWAAFDSRKETWHDKSFDKWGKILAGL